MPRHTTLPPKKRILFVRGFNTDMNDQTIVDVYSPFTTVFSAVSSCYEYDYFTYSPKEHLDKVYKRLCYTITHTKYDILIGHSMGGGLVLHYMNKHPDKISQYKQIILLMPLIYKRFVNIIISKIPFIDKVSIPKPLFLPAHHLWNDGNLLNESYNLVSLHQPVVMYAKYMLDDDDIIHTLNAAKPNCVLFYASDEKFNNIGSCILDQIEKKEIVSGKHECFNEKENSVEFFHTFLKYI